METSRTEAENLTIAADWDGACRRMVETIKREMQRYPTYAERSVGTGQGAGGDFTLVIDEVAEDAVFAELAALAETGAAFYAISEERGVVEFGSHAVKVVVDPIDGSLNAKRVAQSWSLSVAVAVGEKMEDVIYGYVYDFGADEEWIARVGRGATLNGARLDPFQDGNGLEVVGLESTKPAFMTPELLARFDGEVSRIRSIGSIALTLCQVAAARYDGMLSLRACRSVDAAAAQLIAREAGAAVVYGDDEGLVAPLDLEPYKPIAAGRDAERARFLISSLA
ncbi:MAG: inositol monophosphatase family protein [Solirubrobacterales bacterium]